jgi:hypothetical protein
MNPLTTPSAILTKRQFRARLGPILTRIEEELEGTAPERAPIRRFLRLSKEDLLAADMVNLLFPATRAGVAGLVAMGLATQAEADRVLAVPASDIPPQVPAPDGTVAAVWDGWPVWAAQCPPGATWVAQTPDGDVTIVHPDYLVTMQLGGSQYRARHTEVELL